MTHPKPMSGSAFAFLSALIIVFSVYFYIYYLYPVWEYQGFTYSFDFVRSLTALVILIVFASLVWTSHSISFIFSMVFFIAYFIPASTIYVLSNYPSENYYMIVYASFLMVILSRIRVKLFNFGLYQGFVMVAFLLASITSAWYLYSVSGRINFNILNIYDFRSENSYYFGGLASYMYAISTKCLLPIGLALALQMKRYFYAAMFFGTSVVFFMLTGHKSMIFYPIVVIGIFYSIRNNRFVHVLLLGILIGFFVSFLDLYLYQNVDEDTFGWIVSLFVRRTLFVPSLLDYQYITIFKSELYYYWSMSRITLGLVPSPHDVPAPFLVGLLEYRRPEMSANTGFIGSGYSQAGVLGVSVYTVLAGLLIGLLNSKARGENVPMIAAAAGNQIFTLFTATDTLTLFFTHGFAITLIVILLLKPDRSRPEPELALAQPAGSRA